MEAKESHSDPSIIINVPLLLGGTSIHVPGINLLCSPLSCACSPDHWVMCHTSYWLWFGLVWFFGLVWCGVPLLPRPALHWVMCRTFYWRLFNWATFLLPLTNSSYSARGALLDWTVWFRANLTIFTETDILAEFLFLTAHRVRSWG